MPKVEGLRSIKYLAHIVSFTLHSALENCVFEKTDASPALYSSEFTVLKSLLNSQYKSRMKRFKATFLIEET